MSYVVCITIQWDVSGGPRVVDLGGVDLGGYK